MPLKWTLLWCSFLSLATAACSEEHLPETPVPGTPCETDAECVIRFDECTACGQVSLHVDDVDAPPHHQ